MSIFAARASQISATEFRFRDSQFRTGKRGKPFPFVSQHSRRTK
jgi:hypothetical protein